MSIILTVVGIAEELRERAIDSEASVQKCRLEGPTQAWNWKNN